MKALRGIAVSPGIIIGKARIIDRSRVKILYQYLIDEKQVHKEVERLKDALRATQEQKAVYLSAIGGAASLIADAVKEVVAVYKKDEFGVPEAFWVIRVEGFPAVVTMDAHGRSIHDDVEAESKKQLTGLIG